MGSVDLQRSHQIVLFGEGGTALNAAACLRTHRITVISAIDEPRLASLSRFVHNRIRVSERSVAELTRSLESLRSSTDEQLLLFPCSDAWIETLSDDLERTLRLGRILPIAREHFALTLDKAVFVREITRLKLPCPVTLNARTDLNWKPPSYPFVLKPYSTYKLEAQCGVKGMLIQGPQDWLRFDKRLLNSNAFLAQEYLGGASISVCFCTTTDGRIAGAYATEKVHYRRLEAGCRVATVNRPDAIDLASRFISQTGFIGYGELEMIDSTRGLVILELNARPWSQILMAHSLGIPILDMAVCLMSGKEVPEYPTCITAPLEWVAWDRDLLFRRAMRCAGSAVCPPMASRRVYAQSFFRDPIPAIVYAFTISPLGPGRFM